MFGTYCRRGEVLVYPFYEYYANDDQEYSPDEVELITEVQWHFADRAFAKINNAFGLTSMAGDWLPEIGVMFSF